MSIVYEKIKRACQVNCVNVVFFQLKNVGKLTNQRTKIAYKKITHHILK